MYANYYHDRLGLDIVIARFQNVYGPWEILGAGRWRGTPETVWRNVTPTFVYRALKGMALRLDSEGTATRDFIYVDDIVRGLSLCATEGSSGEVYNLASGVETSIWDLARVVISATESGSALDVAPGRPWDHSGRRFGSTAKSRDRLGFEAKVTLEDGVAATVAWTRSNLTEIESSIAKHRGQMEASSQELP
jgi:nucleoside-diphosphate-sugar epimerase